MSEEQAKYNPECNETCPMCGAFVDREIGGIYCSNDECSWGIDGTDFQTLKNEEVSHE